MKRRPRLSDQPDEAERRGALLGAIWALSLLIGILMLIGWLV